jgi:hypothetical protein
MWVEMLSYSAVRCRGYLHAKSLGEGGECLTSIWLLWLFMGMVGWRLLLISFRGHSCLKMKAA